MRTISEEKDSTETLSRHNGNRNTFLKAKVYIHFMYIWEAPVLHMVDDAHISV